MKFGLVLICFLVTRLAFGGDTIYGSKYSNAPAMIVNGVVVMNIASYPWQNQEINIYDSSNFWIGGLYVNNNISIENYVLTNQEYGSEGTLLNLLNCIIYIQPGESVTIVDSPGVLNRTFYEPDTIVEIESFVPGCGGVLEQSIFTITIKYLSGPLEQYYLNHFDPSYTDSLATIQNIESGKQSTIYPNPTTGLLNFTNYYPNNGTAGVEIFDISGREVIQQNFEVSPGLQTNPVDIGNLPNGVYLVQYTVNGNSRTEKMVKM
jgi:Secretion system C-terminal sorting domain